MSSTLNPTREEDRNGFRKHHRDGEKVKHDFPYWLEILGVEHDPTPALPYNKLGEKIGTFPHSLDRQKTLNLSKNSLVAKARWYLGSRNEKDQYRS